MLYVYEAVPTVTPLEIDEILTSTNPALFALDGIAITVVADWEIIRANAGPNCTAVMSYPLPSCDPRMVTVFSPANGPIIGVTDEILPPAQ